VPLLLTALAVVVAFRAGVWNIGAEGQFIAGGIGALLAAMLGTGSIVALLAGAAAGALWALLPALMKVLRNAPEVLTTILLNFVAIHLLGYVVNGPLQEGSGQYPQSEAVPPSAVLASLGGSSLHSGVVLAAVLAVVVWFVLFRTAAGLRLRAVGLNPRAAEYAGVPARPRIVTAMLMSGALGGIAGAVELLGVTHRLYDRFASGYGYSGITVALLAQTHPLGAVASAFFIAALRTGSGELQRASGISSSVAVLGEGLAIVAMVLFRFRATKGREDA
jgi:simple sugar transport system permease protein